MVDHDGRRAELAAAVWSLIRDSGLEGVTIRALEERSGWSSGAIRHYLPNREAILTFAAQHLGDRVEARLRQLPRTADPYQDFLGALCEVLPLDDERRAEAQVWLAYVGLSISDPCIARLQGVAYRDLNLFLQECFGGFARLGWLPHSTPQEAAAEVQALLDGLNIHLLLGQITPEQATTLVHRRMNQILRP